MNKLESWFYDLCKSFGNAGYQFHGYNWILPGVFPILALLIMMLLSNPLMHDWMALYNVTITQMMFFTIITSILNMATINKLKKKEESSSNDFFTSLFISLTIMVSYVGFYYNTYILKYTGYSYCHIFLIFLFTLFFFCLAVMLYSKNCESFNKNIHNPEKLWIDKEKQVIIENNIENNVEMEKETIRSIYE